MNVSRKERVSRLVQQVLGDAFLRHVHDSMLRGLMITRVVMPQDLKTAKVYFEVLGSTELDPKVLVALERQRRALQARLAKETGLRNTPVLEFVHDEELREADHVLSLIEDLDVPPPEEPEVTPSEE